MKTLRLISCLCCDGFGIRSPSDQFEKSRNQFNFMTTLNSSGMESPVSKSVLFSRRILVASELMRLHGQFTFSIIFGSFISRPPERIERPSR